MVLVIKQIIPLIQINFVIKMFNYLQSAPIEIYQETLYLLRLQDINNTCHTNKYAQNICADISFWEEYMDRNYPGYEIPDNFVYSENGKWIEIMLVIKNFKIVEKMVTPFYLTPGTKLEELQQILIAFIENIHHDMQEFKYAIMDSVYIPLLFKKLSFGIDETIWDLVSYISENFSILNTLPEELYDVLDSIEIRMSTMDENATFILNFEFDRL
jgi:hypothetical protein